MNLISIFLLGGSLELMAYWHGTKSRPPHIAMAYVPQVFSIAFHEYQDDQWKLGPLRCHGLTDYYLIGYFQSLEFGR
jgi:hypothetical protein